MCISFQRDKIDCTVECIIEGPSLESLKSLAASQLVIPFSESPCIHIDVDADEEDMVGAAIAYYKHGRFNKEASVRVGMRQQPGVDMGGVRRQFFPWCLVILHCLRVYRHLRVLYTVYTLHTGLAIYHPGS